MFYLLLPTSEYSDEEVTRVEIDTERYCDWLRERGRAPSTIATYKTQIVSFLRWADGKTPTVALLCEYRDWLMQDKPGWRNIQATGRRPRTVGSAFCALRSLRDWLKIQGHDFPPLEAVELPRRDEPQRDVPSPAEMKRWYGGCDRFGSERTDPRFRVWRRAQAFALSVLAEKCGLRRREILALNLTDIVDLHGKRSLTVRRTKHCQSRWVPIPDAAWEHLENWLKLRKSRAARMGQVGAALLTDDRGRRMGLRSVENIVRGVKQLAGLEERTKLTLHSLRHVYATNLLLAGVDIKTISTLLGHSSPSVTLDIYCHTTPERMRDAAELATRQTHIAEPKRDSDSEGAKKRRVERSGRGGRQGGRRKPGR